MINEFRKLGLELPAVLMPDESIDLTKWAVVACDQYTSQPDYWHDVEKLVGDDPSTLHLIFPEVYLEEGDSEERISRINEAMKSYLADNLLVAQKPGFILIDRKTSHAASRKGLIVALDLEKYDYRKGSQTLIRATEGTVVDRLPPRIRIRQNASVELPHIMVLIDDPEKTVIEPIAQKTEQLDKLYDFDLMLGGGHIKGYKVDSDDMLSSVLKALQKLADQRSFEEKYKVGNDKGLLLFAVGDGNHSLASAKGHWENVKKGLSEAEQAEHPARFALVELVNVHDEGLEFEPIHRIVFNVDPNHLLESMVKHFEKEGCRAEIKKYDTKQAMKHEMEKLSASQAHSIAFVTKDTFGTIDIKSPFCTLEVGSLQTYLEEYMKENSSIRIDYIHGEDVVDNLGSAEGNIGFYLPPMNKNDLFKTVILDGVLPKKTFSMGEAEEKRFYLESRKIVK
ncbi:MAG TPA: DUF1015 family protein [Clostridia bacterium]|nr:DUF1015 family protein [Clostridia bacterium]